MLDTMHTNHPSETFNQSDLNPGDILLLAIKDYDNPVEEFADFIGSAMAALKAWEDGKSSDKILGAAMKMIQISIAVFDGDRFSHAAIVGYPKQGGADASVVIEIGPGGMAASDLSEYLAAHKNPVAAVRYTADGTELGGTVLPHQPVVLVANDLVTGDPIKYGYFNAFVLAMLCAWRKSDGLAIKELREALIRYFGESHRAAIEFFFVVCGDNLRDLLIKLSHVAGDYLRNKKELVCSEMVAACFNDATNPETGAHYPISFDRRPEDLAPSRGSGTSGDDVDRTRLAEELAELAEAIKKVDYSPDLREPGLFFSAANSANDKPGWWGNNLYTPADLSRSVNMRPLGDWSRQ